MGAELIITHLAINADAQPDWENARRFVNEMNEVGEGLQEEGFTTEEYNDPLDAAKKRLLDALDALKLAIDEGDRNMVAFDVRGVRVYVIGGTSWGDDPGELFTHVNLLDKAGAVLEAAGFTEGS